MMLAKSPPAARPSKPRCYLAGKIGPCGWRDEIAAMPRIDADEAFDPYFEEEYASFILTGPFFVGCDHCCSHGPGTHGAGRGCESGENGAITQRQRRIHNLQCQRIKRADLMFAFINEGDCFGTIAEIGYAASQSKYVAIAYGPGLKAGVKAGLWFVERFAVALVEGFDAAAAFGIALDFYSFGIGGRPSEPLRIFARQADKASVRRRTWEAEMLAPRAQNVNDTPAADCASTRQQKSPREYAEFMSPDIPGALHPQRWP